MKPTNTIQKVMDLVEGEGRRKTHPVAGVDVHKDVLAYCIIDAEALLVEGTLSNTMEGIQRFIQICTEFHVESVAFESTSVYHLKLMFALLDTSIPVLLANPVQTAATQGKKTDKLDARRLALAHRDGRLKPSVISPKEIEELRTCTRQLEKIIRDQTKSKQRLAQLLHKLDCILQRTFPNLFKSTWLLELLQAILDEPDKMIEELVERYYQKAKRRNQRDHDRRVVLAELTQLRERLSPLDRVTLRTELVQITIFEQLAEQQRLVYLSLAKTNETFRKHMEILLSIPGIGPDSAAIILAEIVSVGYFPTPQKLAKWAGLAPRVLQSGHKKRITGPIHKGGNKYLRRALTLVCATLYAHGNEQNPLYRFIKTKYQVKGAYWLAICAGARKLLCICWTLLQNQCSWKPLDENDLPLLEQMAAIYKKKLALFRNAVDRYEQRQQKVLDLLNAIQHSIPDKTDTTQQLYELLFPAS